MNIGYWTNSENLIYQYPLLFHDGNRISYTKLMRDFTWWSYSMIRNFEDGDSTEVYGVDRPVFAKDISPNDEFIYVVTAYDEGEFGYIFNTINYSRILTESTFKGSDFGKFSDDGRFIYGIESENFENPGSYPALAYNLQSGEKIIFDNVDKKKGFTTLSYSSISNEFLYSINGDIKVYDCNTRRSYNFMTTSKDERAACFISN